MFSKQLKYDRSAVKPLLKTAGNLLISGSILIVLVAIFNSYDLLNLIYDRAEESIQAFNWLMLGFIAICMNFIFGTLLTANGNLKILNISSALGILINIGLNFTLIPRFGAEGAAFASFATQSFVAIIQFIFCLKFFQLSISFRTILKYCIFVLVLLVVSFNLIHFKLLSPVQIFSGSLLMFAFSCVDRKNLKELLLNNSNFK
jgi:O-antigen/teichoic acid export membrane protein